MTIHLNQNQANDVIVTLLEKSKLWLFSGITPYYLFQFESPTTKQTINFVSTNLSPFSAQNSYDEFTIICTGATSVNLTGGTIHLNPGVFWNYNIYEQTTRDNLLISNTVGLVETGKVEYSAATQDFPYISMTGNTGYIVFNTQG